MSMSMLRDSAPSRSRISALSTSPSARSWPDSPAGSFLLAVLERLTGREALLWSGLAFVVLLLSLGGPFGAGIMTSSRIVLVCLHLAVAAILIPLLRATVASSPRR